MNTRNEREVWIFAEQRDGRLLDVGLELLGEGRKLATELHGQLTTVLLGHRVQELGKELLAYGADKVYIVDKPALEKWRCEAYTLALGKLVEERSPEILLLGATAVGADLSARLAARLKTGLSADCVGLEIGDEGQLLQQIPAFGGGVIATIVCPDRRPQMATVRPGVMEKPPRSQGHGSVEVVDMTLPQEKIRTEVIEVCEAEVEPTDLPGADIVVAGGWGIGSSEGWKLVQRLAATLDGAVGATRPALDEGWASEEQMIGQSGVTVRPTLYIGIGISGVMHHVVGIQDADVIVAINNDPNAPIFQVCDVGIVGDYKEVVPLLINQLKKRLNREEEAGF